jgi:hypothetical protein
VQASARHFEIVRGLQTESELSGCSKPLGKQDRRFSGYGTLAGGNPIDKVRGNAELAGQGAPDNSGGAMNSSRDTSPSTS